MSFMWRRLCLAQQAPGQRPAWTWAALPAPSGVCCVVYSAGGTSVPAVLLV